MAVDVRTGKGWVVVLVGTDHLPSLDFLIHKVTDLDLILGFQIEFLEAPVGAMGGFPSPSQ